MSDYEMDDLDRAIIRELEDDGRRALREIGRSVGASEATIRARVKRLQDLGILRIVAFADPRSLGDSQLNLAFLSVEPGRHDEVVTTLVELPEVTYVSSLMGRADICLEISTRDNEDLWRFLREKVNPVPGVTRVETMAVMEVHKLRYTTPV
jgi:Lrp/AsnC family transcriptional regulator for asnA, asnC and gidA